MPHIYVFGDSIAYGAWDSQGGWVQRLRSFIEQEMKRTDSYYLVYNLGISGDTSKDVLARFRREIEVRNEDEEEHIVLFAIGTNDANTTKSGQNVVPVEQFKNNMTALFEQAHKVATTIVCVGLDPVDEQRTQPIPWATHLSAKNKVIKSYNDALIKLCTAQKIHFVDTFEANLGHPRDLDDGVHPNSIGHERIYDLVRNYLIKHRILRFS